MGYSPWDDLASRPHIRYERSRLAGILGYTEPGLIRIDGRQRRVQARCTLAHELAHIDRGDLDIPVDDTPDGNRLAARHERGADALAARRLIDIRDLVQALLWTSDVHEASDELRVDADTLRARLDHLHPAERHYLRRRLAARDNTEGEM